MTFLLGLVAVVSPMIPPEPPDRPELERLGFLVGEWKAVFDPPPGNTSLEMTGEVRTRWGLDRAWIESDFVADASAGLPPSGSGQARRSSAETAGPRYAVHILIAGNRTTGATTALAVNTLSPVPIVYEGRVVAANHVSFLGSAAGKWQKVTYTLLDPERLDFLVEEAGTPEGPWSRHSHATLTRLPPKR